MGLSRKHHVELNRPGVSKRRLEQLRQEYANDPKALQQIDVYDRSTKYHDRLDEFKRALKASDTKKERRLSRWFKKHYPDI